MTGLKFVLDTNIVIGLLKGATEADGLRKSLGIELGNSAVSQITRIELLSYPRLSINEEQSIRAFLDACEMLSLSARVEDETIAIRRSAGLKLSLPRRHAFTACRS